MLLECMLAGALSGRCLSFAELVQAEGGFVYAMGMLMQEGVTYDAKGQPEFDTTWNYKIPSAACIPREIIIRMLQVHAYMASLQLYKLSHAS